MTGTSASVVKIVMRKGTDRVQPALSDTVTATCQQKSIASFQGTKAVGCETATHTCARGTTGRIAASHSPTRNIPRSLVRALQIQNRSHPPSLFPRIILSASAKSVSPTLTLVSIASRNPTIFVSVFAISIFSIHYCTLLANIRMHLTTTAL